MRQSHKTTIVGLAIAFALTLLAIGILAVGREQGFFRDRVTFVTDFPNVDGLTIGSSVRLIGVQVGVVTAIRLPDDISKQEVDVEFGVDRRYWDRIRAGTTATLKNLTYLSGEKYIEVRPGDPTRARIPEGGYIDSPQTEVERLLARSQNIAENIEEISVMLKDLLLALNRGESVLSQLITDPEFGQGAMGSATETLKRLNHIVTRLDEGRGMVGRLLSDDEYAESTLSRMTALLDRFEGMADRIDAGEGLLGQLMVEDSDLADAAREMREVLASARELIAGLEAGQGTVGRLLVDDEYGRTVTQRIDFLLADIASIVHKIETGEGTLGRLVNEPELYDEATDVMGGLSDSRFLKWVARRVRNKKIKRKIEEFADELERAQRAGEGSD